MVPMSTPADTLALLSPVETVALIGVLGIGAQWLAWRLQLPAIVLMSVAGLLVGPASAFLLHQPIVDPAVAFGDLLRPIISLAVAIILFEGGLVLRFSDLKDTGAAVRRLVFFGGRIPGVWARWSVIILPGSGLAHLSCLQAF
jgi:NhaP-type Na+/H+ or K+/H+ antiporter